MKSSLSAWLGISTACCRQRGRFFRENTIVNPDKDKNREENNLINNDIVVSTVNSNAAEHIKTSPEEPKCRYINLNTHKQPKQDKKQTTMVFLLILAMRSKSSVTG